MPFGCTKCFLCENVWADSGTLGGKIWVNSGILARRPLAEVLYAGQWS